MGGPVEFAHFRFIQEKVGEITGLQTYDPSYCPIPHRREYMKSDDAGAVTDDTFIRSAFARFYLATKAPRTPRLLTNWMEANEDFSFWWHPVAEQVHRVARGEADPDTAGRTFTQGGGNGWWTPVGILNAGNPAGAEAEVPNLSRIWKRGGTGPAQRNADSARPEDRAR
ncbi:ADP-ribosylglycohydrolase family protein [Bradyrhizobium sp. USDA 336]|uniref:ADP-ribosylglycohydrolase family protein n=1 Tax=Bradyrhizobium sp. USDA 336 TaxID=3156311 RepID=UPI00384C49AA